MKCSFDKKESCSIENIMNNFYNYNQLKWILADVNTVSYLKLNKSPESGGNFIFVNNLQQSISYSRSSFKTSTIFIKNGENNKCLSFYLNSGNFSNLEIYKIDHLNNGIKSRIYHSEIISSGILF
jgi:hypothetical protein